jgi:drug/metabolite transporter (DMT)-like permease
MPVMTHIRSTVSSSIYALLSITFWGISFVSAKAVLGKLDPFSLIVFRFGIGAVFLFLLLFVQRNPLRISVHHLPHIIILGILGVFVHQVLQAMALLTIHASSAGWLISFSPIFTAVLSILFLNEKLTMNKAAGMLMAFLGVVLVTAARGGNSLQLSINIGFILMILSTLNWAIYSVLIKKLKLPYPPLLVTFYMCLVGLILTAPFIFQNKGWKALSLLNFSEWTHLLFLGIFVSGIGYWYWGKALEGLEASRVSMFMYLEPIVTFIAAILLLQEKILLMSIAGGIIIIIGVVMVNGQIVPLFSSLFKRR